MANIVRFGAESARHISGSRDKLDHIVGALSHILLDIERAARRGETELAVDYRLDVRRLEDKTNIEKALVDLGFKIHMHNTSYFDYKLFRLLIKW